jgi:hypothetical protein
LALLLTGDEAAAERCFVSALEDCKHANGVFRDWARSWARRAVVLNAIRIVQPSRVHAVTQPGPMRNPATLESVAPLGAVARLHAFERFVYVASVLERYSDQDCKVLLECTRQDVVRARRRAMVRLADFAGPAPVRVTPSEDQMFARAS